MGMKFLHIPPQAATDERWTMKDGKEIPVCEMSEQHAKNALRLVLRRKRELATKAAQLDEQGLLSELTKLFKPE